MANQKPLPLVCHLDGIIAGWILCCPDCFSTLTLADLVPFSDGVFKEIQAGVFTGRYSGSVKTLSPSKPSSTTLYVPPGHPDKALRSSNRIPDSNSRERIRYVYLVNAILSPSRPLLTTHVPGLLVRATTRRHPLQLPTCK